MKTFQKFSAPNRDIRNTNQQIMKQAYSVVSCVLDGFSDIEKHKRKKEEDDDKETHNRESILLQKQGAGWTNTRSESNLYKIVIQNLMATIHIKIKYKTQNRVSRNILTASTVPVRG